MSKAEATKRRILNAATSLFADKPFDQVSVRAIARQAGVDPALIHHYFGTKEDLFATALEDLVRPELLDLDITAHPREAWGVQLVRTVLALWSSDLAPAVSALFRTGLSSHPELLRHFVMRAVLSRIAGHLDGPPAERELRAVLVGSQVVGLVVARHLVGVEPLASMPDDEIAAAVGPTIQRYLTGELTE